MIRTALDSDKLDVFTVRTDFIFTYSDIVPDAAEFEHAHPWAQVRYIDRGLGDPGTKATIADVERGAMRPADLPKWLDARTLAHKPYLTMYCNRSNLGACNEAIGKRPVNRWIATLDGTVKIPGFRAMFAPAIVQVLPAGDLGIDCDFSLVLEPGWNPAPAPAAVANVLANLNHARVSLADATAHVGMALTSARTIK